MRIRLYSDLLPDPDPGILTGSGAYSGILTCKFKFVQVLSTFFYSFIRKRNLRKLIKMLGIQWAYFNDCERNEGSGCGGLEQEDRDLGSKKYAGSQPGPTPRVVPTVVGEYDSNFLQIWPLSFQVGFQPLNIHEEC